MASFHMFAVWACNEGTKAAMISHKPTSPDSHPCHGFALTIQKPAVATTIPTMRLFHKFPVGRKQIDNDVSQKNCQDPSREKFYPRTFFVGPGFVQFADQQISAPGNVYQRQDDQQENR